MVFDIIWRNVVESNERMKKMEREERERRAALRHNQAEEERYKEELKTHGEYARKPNEESDVYWKRVFYLERERRFIFSAGYCSYQFKLALAKATTLYILNEEKEIAFMEEQHKQGRAYPSERFEEILEIFERKIASKLNCKPIKSNSNEDMGRNFYEKYKIRRENIFFDGDEPTVLNILSKGGLYTSDEAIALTEAAEQWLDTVKNKITEHNKKVDEQAAKNGLDR